MRIAIQTDNTLHLPLVAIAEQLNSICREISVTVATSGFRIDTPRVSVPSTFIALPKSLREEAKSFDFLVLFTAVPYDNNFFYEECQDIVIVSSYGWNLVTSLPLINGLFYF